MLLREDINYFNRGFKENEKFWERLGEKPEFKDKSILDFGCGHGALCIDIAGEDARDILGIDLEEKPLSFAQENLATNYKNLKDRIEFKKINLLEYKIDKKFDYIVSKDTFEHTQNLPKVLDKMYDLLNVGGKVFLGFGPLYNFFNGDHGRTKMFLPWFHLLFSEKFLIKRINFRRKDKIKKIEDLGLSKYSLKQYEDFLKNSKFKILIFKTNQTKHPVGKAFNILSKLKFLKEYFTFNIYCILEK